MSSTKLRTTGQRVNRVAIESLWSTLCHLWEEYPLAFIELVRKARKGRHQVFQHQSVLHNLENLGFADRKRNYAIHESYRELIRGCVEGKGLHMMLYRPFMDDAQPIGQHMTLRGGATATTHLVDAVMTLLREILEEDYVSFVEFVRLVRREIDANCLFGISLLSLLERGAVELVTPPWNIHTESLKEFSLLFGIEIPMILMDRRQKLVVRDYVQSILSIAAIGSKGLDFDLRSPYAESNGYSHDGHPAKKTVVNGNPGYRNSMGAHNN